MKVIGAGFGRTGTASLQRALVELGFGPCYHMFEVFSNPGHAGFWEAAWRGEPADWDGILGPYGATVDWPGCAFYEEFMRRHPDAKVLLSVRDPRRWYESVRRTIYELNRLSTGSPFSRLGFALLSRSVFGSFKTGQAPMADEIIFQGTFGGRFEDEDHAKAVFERHNAEVRRKVPPEKLLVYEVEQGWGPLCDFLGVEEPDGPFPHLNDASEVRRLILLVRALSVAVPAALALVVGTAVGTAALALRRGPLRKASL